MAELASIDLAALGAAELVRVSASILRAAPGTFVRLTARFVFPLSCAVLAHTLFTDPMDILLRVQVVQGGMTNSDLVQWLRLWAYQFLYIMVAYTFAALCTAAAVFTVASLYANKPVSVSSVCAALPAVVPRLFDTLSWVPFVTSGCHLVFVLIVFGLIVVFIPKDASSESAPPLPLSFFLCLAVVVVVFLGIYVYVSALSVVEPLSELSAFAKSKQLLQGRTGTAATLVVSYFAVAGVTWLLFRAAVVKGSFGLALPWRLLVGAVLVCVLVCANLLGLLVQSVFYFACKAFHNQKIDRTALCEHLALEGTLGSTCHSRAISRWRPLRLEQHRKDKSKLLTSIIAHTS